VNDERRPARDAARRKSDLSGSMAEAFVGPDRLLKRYLRSADDNEVLRLARGVAAVDRAVARHRSVTVDLEEAA
jgi:hypothetical protein